MYDRLHDLPEITLDTLSEAFGIADKSIRNLRKNPECIDGRTITGAKRRANALSLMKKSSTFLNYSILMRLNACLLGQLTITSWMRLITRLVCL